jgi:hypothetical protein
MDLMKKSIQSDLKRLGNLAFHRTEQCGPIMRDFHSMADLINVHPHSIQIWQIYEWLLTPLSLWPIDFDGLSRHLLSLVEKRTEFDEEIVLLLALVGCAPDMQTQDAIGEFEHLVETGNYDDLLRQPDKFKESDFAIKRDDELQRSWAEIKKRWDLTKFQNTRGVIRRRMSQERNFRPDWGFDWNDSESKFHSFFDAMCYRWKLYGMQRDDPLLLKVTVNPTPHGTMIFIPRHWSLDLARDLHWNKIGKLHKAHGAARQGPKLSRSRIAKAGESVQVKAFWDEAQTKKIRGNSRYDYVLKKMHKDIRTDHSWVNRLLSLARRKNGGNLKPPS